MHIISEIPWDGQYAKKTRGIYCIPVCWLLRDRMLFNHLKLVTLEGDTALNPDAMLCTGINKVDPWQQDKLAVLSAYTLESFTEDGWLYMVPKPVDPLNPKAHLRECVKVTDTLLPSEFSEGYLETTNTHAPELTIGDKKINAFRFRRGDYILRSDRHLSPWVVDGKIFNQTYELTLRVFPTNIQTDING